MTNSCIGCGAPRDWSENSHSSRCKECRYAYDTIRYYSNKQKRLEQHKAYRLSNPDVSRRAGHRRRARKLHNGYEVYTEKQVLSLYGTDCHICNKSINLRAPRSAGKKGWEFGLHIDHLVPISKGGPDTLENVRPSHAICNMQKSDRI